MDSKSPSPTSSLNMPRSQADADSRSVFAEMAAEAKDLSNRVNLILNRNGKQHVVANLANFRGSFAPSARPDVVNHARPWYRCPVYLTHGWTDPLVWRAGVIEFYATLSLIIIASQIFGTMASYGIKQIGPYIGITNTLLIAVLIYATAPATGGHMNPIITFSTVLCGLCPVSRGVIYMTFQLLGASVAGGILRGIWGVELGAQLHGGSACFYDTSSISSGSVFLNEMISGAIMLFVSYGVGLDPRMALLYGPKLGPLFVGFTVGLVTFASSTMMPGYGGAQANPTKCFASGIARGNMGHMWPYWVGPFAACVLQAILYNLNPPVAIVAPAPELPSTNSSGDNETEV